MKKKIVGIHLLVPLRSRMRIQCEVKRGGWGSAVELDGHVGNAICVTERSLVTCPWCLGARTRKEAREMVKSIYEREIE